MGDKTRGLYHKFNVERADGSSAPGGKHDGCDYFVLDLTHDKHAPAGLRGYIESCQGDYPLLANDLRAKVPALPTTPKGERLPDVRVEELRAIIADAINGMRWSVAFKAAISEGADQLCDQALAPASETSTPYLQPADENGKRKRLFYWEDTEDAWCPAEGLEIENIIDVDSFFADGEEQEIKFKRSDMTDAEFDALPEG